VKLIRKLKKKYPAAKRMIGTWYKNLTSQQPFTRDDEANLHISLTSYGKKIQNVYYTIESIFDQSIGFSSVTLWLSREDITEEQLPKSLLRLKSRGLRVRFVDENIRSYKKLYYTYEELLETKNQSALIVTADDDIFYTDTWLEELLSCHNQEPNKVICHRGHRIALDDSGDVKPYREWNSSDGASLDLENVLMPTGIAGVLYPMEALVGLEQQKDQFMELCGFADDIWFKCLAKSNGIGAIKVDDSSNSNPLPLLSLEFKRRGLALYNVYQGGNDKQMAAAMKFFGLDFRS